MEWLGANPEHRLHVPSPECEQAKFVCKGSNQWITEYTMGIDFSTIH